jgi:DNA primase
MDSTNDIPIMLDNLNIIINKWSQAFFIANRAEEDGTKYLESRGILLETCKKLGIGFWPISLESFNARKVLYEYLKSKALTDKELKSYTLIKEKNSTLIDAFPLAISFPIFMGKDIVNWYFRGIDPLSARKHHNTSGLKYLFNEKALQNKEELYVCEGPFDCASLIQLGYNAIATLGVYPSEAALNALKSHKNIIICYDNDDNNAGQKSAKRLAFQLIIAGSKVRIASLPKDNNKCDINQLLIDGRTGELARALDLAKDFSGSTDFERMERSRVASEKQKTKSKYETNFKRSRINRVKNITIKDVVSEYTCIPDEEKPLIRCIFDDHNDSSPSFHIKGDRFICYGCGKKGDVIQLVRDKESLSFWKAIEYMENNFM